MVRIARANRRTVPQFASMVLPATESASQIASHAHAIATVVTPYQQHFVDHGLPGDFIAQMLSDADAMVATVTDKGDSRTSRVKATDSIAKTAQDARTALGVLDTLVRARLHDSEPLVRAWRDASRVVSNKGGNCRNATDPVPDTASSEPVAQAA